MRDSKDMTAATGPAPVAPASSGPSGNDHKMTDKSIDSLPNSVPASETLARAQVLAASGTNDKAARR